MKISFKESRLVFTTNTPSTVDGGNSAAQQNVENTGVATESADTQERQGQVSQQRAQINKKIVETGATSWALNQAGQWVQNHPKVSATAIMGAGAAAGGAMGGWPGAAIGAAAALPATGLGLAAGAVGIDAARTTLNAGGSVLGAGYNAGKYGVQQSWKAGKWTMGKGWQGTKVVVPEAIKRTPGVSWDSTFGWTAQPLVGAINTELKIGAKGLGDIGKRFSGRFTQILGWMTRNNMIREWGNAQVNDSRGIVDNLKWVTSKTVENIIDRTFQVPTNAVRGFGRLFAGEQGANWVEKQSANIREKIGGILSSLVSSNSDSDTIISKSRPAYLQG